MVGEAEGGVHYGSGGGMEIIKDDEEDTIKRWYTIPS